MPQRELRVIPVMTHLEPTLHEKLREVVDEHSITYSTFLRSLLIRELTRTNRLTPEDLVKITAG